MGKPVKNNSSIIFIARMGKMVYDFCMITNPEKAKATIIKHLRNGESLSYAADQAKIARRTVYYWMSADKEFRTQVRNAKMQALLEAS